MYYRNIIYPCFLKAEGEGRAQFFFVVNGIRCIAIRDEIMHLSRYELYFFMELKKIKIQVFQIF
nr:hypothetical protein BAR15_130006 [Bartonella sp. AR 15-3]